MDELSGRVAALEREVAELRKQLVESKKKSADWRRLFNASQFALKVLFRGLRQQIGPPGGHRYLPIPTLTRRAFLNSGD